MNNTKKGYALITGGGAGLGLEIAKLIAAEGYPLILCGRREEILEKGADVCRGAGAPEVRTVSCDLSQKDGISLLHRSVAELCSQHDRELEMVVNNAGRGLFGPVEEQESGDLASMLRLNIEALTLLCRLFIPELKQSGSGKILNVGSLAGGQPMPFFAAYGATKSFVHSFSLALRAELRGSGISVTLLEPGFIRTGFDEAAGIGSKKYRSFSFRNGMSAEKVAVKGVRAMFRHKAKVMPGIGNKLSAFFGSLLPETLIAALMKRSVMGLTGKKD
jgi:short-subunit dehydrogenase